MTLLEPLIGWGVLIIVCAVISLVVLRYLRSRSRRGALGAAVDAPTLGADALGERATLLQFAVGGCTRSPAVHAALRDIAQANQGVLHLHVDLSARGDLIRRFDVSQTPTTLLLDADGIVRARFGGIPTRSVVELELQRVLAGSTDAATSLG